jgi:polygalacturonase
MKLKVRLALFLFLFVQFGAWAGININISQFGVLNDGKTLNTIKIQMAIDSCYHLGGGTVNFPKGNYLTSTVLKSPAL